MPALVLVGGKQLRRTLRKAGIDLAEMRAVHRQAAQVAMSASRPPHRSNDLAGSQRIGATNTTGTLRAGGVRVPYAGVIHYGWPARNITEQPWLLQAAKRTEHRWIALYKAFLDRVLEQIQGE